MPDMNEFLRQAQIMQTKMTKIQEDLEKRTVTAASGGGMVTVVCNGKQELQNITIDKTVINPADSEMLEDLILTAVNEGLRLSRDLATQEMTALTGGLRIPGL